MSSFRIPDKYLTVLEKIAKLSNDDVKLFLEALINVRPSLNKEQLVSNLSSKIKTLESSDISKILDMLLSLYSLREYVSNETLIKELSEALLESLDEKLSDKDQENLETRLKDLLELQDNIGVISKAKTLLEEYERLYLKGKIITDIRPIFKSEITQNLAGAIITYSLKINYLDKSGDKEFYIALDMEDLQQLREQIERAEGKAKSLEEILNKANIACLNFNLDE